MTTKQKPDCPACGEKNAPLEWNPYDGVWECAECGSDEVDRLIGVGPRDAEFAFTNQNPTI